MLNCSRAGSLGQAALRWRDGTFGAATITLWPMSATAGDGTVALSSVVAVLTLLLIAALAAAAGAAWSRQRASQAVEAARAEAVAMRSLIDGWQWRSDADHRLSRLQPPPGETMPVQHEAGTAAADVGPARAIESCLAQRAGLPGSPIEMQVEEDAPGNDGTHAVLWALRGQALTDDRGRFAGYSGTARRIGEGRHGEADRAALEVLMRSLPGALWLAQRHAVSGEMTVRRCNEAGLRLAGGDGPGLPWSSLIDRLPADLQPLLRTLEPGASASHGAWSVHLERIGAAGTATEGRLLALLPHAGDAATAAAAAAAAADQESFSYTVSHDLRAPIRVVEGFTRIVKEDYGRALDRIGNDHLDRVLSAAARMNSMIDSLLALARLSSQPLARQPVNLTQLAGFVVDDLRRQHPERAADVQVQPGMMVHGDPTLLRMMLENLLGNAWKYTGKAARAEIAFETARHDGREVFVVRDNGAGFDMRFADRLFGVFQRLHSANDFHGTGVGLASVKRIVHRHGGEIWAESEVGKGARFFFTLRP